MKLKYLIEILQRFNPELEVWSGVLEGENSDKSHGPISVWVNQVKEPWVSGHGLRIAQPIVDHNYLDRGRDSYRTTLTQAGDGPIQSLIQHYGMYSNNEPESEADLTSGAITASEHQDNVERIRERARQKERIEEILARQEYERLKERFG